MGRFDRRAHTQVMMRRENTQHLDLFVEAPFMGTYTVLTQTSPGNVYMK